MACLDRRRTVLGVVLLVCLVVDLIVASMGKPPKSFHVVFISVPALTHLTPMKRLAEEMHRRGYRVSLASIEAKSGWINHTSGVEFISAGSRYDVKEFTPQATDRYHVMEEQLLFFTQYQEKMFQVLYEKLKQETPNLLVVDRFTFAGYDLAHKLNVTYAVNSPTLLLDLDDPPAHVAAPFSGMSTKNSSVWERCLNPYYRLRYNVATLSSLAKVNQARAKVGLPAIASFSALTRRSLVISDSCFGVEDARPLRPLVRMVGPIMPLHPAPLPVDVYKWLARSGTPVVLVSLAPGAQITASLVKAIATGAREAGMRVVWDGTHTHSDDTAVPVADDWVLPLAYVDHVGVLRNEATVAAVFSCSLGAAQEAVASGVPVLCLPSLPVHREVADRLARLGVAAALDPAEATAWDVHRSLDALVEGASTSASLARARILFESAGGLSEAVDAIAEVLDLGPQQRNVYVPRDEHLPWYQLLVLDVYAVYGSVLIAVAVILRTTWSLSRATWRNLHRKMTSEP